MLTARQMKAAEKKARTDRMNAISVGLLEEVRALNSAIRGGREVRFPVRESSLSSGQRVASARYGYDGLWVTCEGYGGSFCLANDTRWEELLGIAGIKRDPRAT